MCDHNFVLIAPDPNVSVRSYYSDILLKSMKKPKWKSKVPLDGVYVTAQCTTCKLIHKETVSTDDVLRLMNKL